MLHSKQMHRAASAASGDGTEQWRRAIDAANDGTEVVDGLGNPVAHAGSGVDNDGAAPSSDEAAAAAGRSRSGSAAGADADAAAPTHVRLSRRSSADATSATDADAASRAQATARTAAEVKALSPVLGLAADTAGPEYAVVDCQMLGQIGVLVLCRKEHYDRVDEVQSGYEATGGPTRTFPNKGGCVVSMRIYGTRFVFVGSHLAAHLQYADVRDLDVAEIIGEVRIGPQPEVDFDA